MKLLNLNDENLMNLISSPEQLYGLIIKLNKTVDNSIIKELLDVYQKLYKISNLAKVHSEDYKFSSKDIDDLEIIANKKGFISKWCIPSIKAENMNEFLPFKIGYISYSNSFGTPEKKEVNNIISWLDFWKLSDKLIKKSGDHHHIFIEGFNRSLNKDGLVDVDIYTGS